MQRESKVPPLAHQAVSPSLLSTSLTRPFIENTCWRRRMNKRFLIAAGIVLLVVVVFVAGVFFWNFVNPKTIKRAEKEEVTALVENFGSKLKEVSLSAPGEIVSQETETIYAPFVLSLIHISEPTRLGMIS